MTKTNQDFTIYAGNTAEISASISGSDAGAYDVSSASIEWTMQEYPKSASLVRKTTDSGITVSTSIVTITIDASDMQNYAGTYHHEARATDASDRVSTLFTGNVIIYKSAFTG